VYKKGCPKSSSPNTDISSPSAPPPPADVYMQELAMLQDFYIYVFAQKQILAIFRKLYPLPSMSNLIIQNQLLSLILKT
jgi:hypothetical protein